LPNFECCGFCNVFSEFLVQLGCMIRKEDDLVAGAGDDEVAEPEIE
jgi:hypothetical protein